MLYRSLGNSPLSVSALSLGSWLTIGDGLEQDSGRELVAAALDAGINSFDTADSYGYGESERAMGEALVGVPREKYVLMSKCYFSTDKAQKDPPGLSRAAVFKAAEASLARLKTDYIDVLQCHRFDASTPIAETVDAMQQLVAQGKIRYWGVSKWSEQAMREARVLGGRHLICHQELYNLFNRQVEEEHFAFCQREGIGFLAYSPLARGVLSGKYIGGIPQHSRAAHPQNRQTIYDLSDAKSQQVQKLTQIAHERGYTASQLALAFCLRLRVVNSVIIGVTSTVQLEENIAAISVHMDSALYDAIDRIFRP